MSEKISEMTSNSAVQNNCLIPIVQAGQNWKTTRLNLLAAISGDVIVVQGGGTLLSIDGTTGDIAIALGSSATEFELVGTAGGIVLDNTGLHFTGYTPGGGDSISQGGGSVSVGVAGAIAFQSTDAGGFTIGNTSEPAMIFVDSSGNILLRPKSGQQITMQNNGGYIRAEPSGEINIFPAGGQFANVGYTPASSGNWSGDPTTEREAIDRIAAAVAGLLAGPIP